MILVTGASGFLGRHVVRELTKRELRVRAMVRSAAGAARLDGVECELVRGEMTEPQSLRAATVGCHTIVHLVSLLTGSKGNLEQVMVRGTNDLVAEARNAGIRRIVLVSALGTSEARAEQTPYFRAKWAMEEAVRQSGIPSVVLRPSLVFGADGGALPRLAKLAALSPVTPILGKGAERIQPIWVDDVADAVRLALTVDGVKTIEIGGPDVVSWRELMQRIQRARGSSRPTLPIPIRVARASAALVERFPGAPISREELTMIALGDNVVSDGGQGMAALGLGATVPLGRQLEHALGAARSSPR